MLKDALTFLVSGGSVVVVSWIAEQIKAFQALVSNVKRWVFFGVATVLSIGSYLVLHYVPDATLLALTPYFVIIAGIFTSLFVVEKFHSVTKVK